jgi:hypothetical protein
MELSFAQTFEGFAIVINLIVMLVVSVSILRRYLETKYPPALLAASGFLVLGFIFTARYFDRGRETVCSC